MASKKREITEKYRELVSSLKSNLECYIWEGRIRIEEKDLTEIETESKP